MSVGVASTAGLCAPAPALAATRAPSREGNGGRGSGGDAGEGTAWVANRALESDPGSTLTPVDLSTRRAEAPVTTASEPAALARWTGGRLLVANKGKDTLTVLRAGTGGGSPAATVASTVGVGLEPDAVAVTRLPTGGWLALVANFGDDTVTPVDLGTMRAEPPIPVGPQPVALAVVPGGPGTPPTALVADFAGGTVTPINLTTMTPGPPVAVGTAPDAVAIQEHGTPTGPVALVADFGSDQVTPVSVHTMTPMPAVAIGGNPTGIAVAQNGTAWIVAGASLTPLSPGSPAAGAPVALPGVGQAVALQGGSTAWVAEQAGSVVPVPLPAGPAGRPVHVGGRPTAIAVSSS
jgi:hyaluronoglucosaminidase